MSKKLTHDEADEYLKTLVKDMYNFRLLSKKVIMFASNIISIEQLGHPENRTYKFEFIYSTKNMSVNVAEICIHCLKVPSYITPKIFTLTAMCKIDPRYYSNAVTKTQLHVAKFIRALFEMRFSCTIENWCPKPQPYNHVSEQEYQLAQLRFEELERIAKSCTRKLNLYTNRAILGENIDKSTYIPSY